VEANTNQSPDVVIHIDCLVSGDGHRVTGFVDFLDGVELLFLHEHDEIQRVCVRGLETNSVDVGIVKMKPTCVIFPSIEDGFDNPRPGVVFPKIGTVRSQEMLFHIVWEWEKHIHLILLEFGCFADTYYTHSVCIAFIHECKLEDEPVGFFIIIVRAIIAPEGRFRCPIAFVGRKSSYIRHRLGRYEPLLHKTDHNINHPTRVGMEDRLVVGTEVVFLYAIENVPFDRFIGI